MVWPFNWWKVCEADVETAVEVGMWKANRSAPIPVDGGVGLLNCGGENGKSDPWCFFGTEKT